MPTKRWRRVGDLFDRGASRSRLGVTPMAVRHYQQADHQRYYSVRHYSVLLIASLIISALMVVFRPSSSTPARRVELVRSAAGQRSWQSRWPVSAPREHASAPSSTAAPPPGAAGTNGQSAGAREALSLASTQPATAAPRRSVAVAASSYQSAEARRAIALAIAEPVPARGDGRRGGLDHEENMRRESDTVRRLLAEDGLPQWRPDPALLPPQAPAGASMGELLQSVPAGGIAWLAFGNSGVTEMLMNWVRLPDP